MNKNDTETFKTHSVYFNIQGWTESSGERSKSVGVNFRCEAGGEPIEKGDNSEEIQWVMPEKLRALLDEADMFSNIDRGAAEMYLSDVNN